MSLPRREAPRWPFEPVQAELERRVGPYDPGHGGYSASLLAVLLGIGTDNVTRWQRRGWLSDDVADRVAIALGRHPSYFWGDAWFSAGLTVVA